MQQFMLLTKLLQQSEISKCSEFSKRGFLGKKKAAEPKVCRIGPICDRDPPPDYAPERLTTTAFTIPPYIKPKIFRPMTKGEKLGPKAAKCAEYKNPEMYSYHRYSFFDLKMATNAVKTCQPC